MDVGFHVTGGLNLAFSEEETKILKEWADSSRSAGIPTEIISRERARALEPGLSNQVVSASYCPLCGHVSSNLVGRAFRRALIDEGVNLKEGTTVLGVSRERASFIVKTSQGIIKANRIVLSGGVWLADMGAWFGVQIPIICRVSQLIATERFKPILNTLIGLADGTLTFKQHVNGTIIVGGGWQGIGDQKRGGIEIIPENIVTNLRYAHSTLPALAQARIVRAWLGLEARVPDTKPIVGPLPGIENVYIIGCIPSGFTIGPFLSRLLADRILERQPEMPLFDADRVIGS
jgi:glycine/D-amino acid oxidase-like deaminating enzyme